MAMATRMLDGLQNIQLQCSCHTIAIGRIGPSAVRNMRLQDLSRGAVDRASRVVEEQLRVPGFHRCASGHRGDRTGMGTLAHSQGCDGYSTRIQESSGSKRVTGAGVLPPAGSISFSYTAPLWFTMNVWIPVTPYSAGQATKANPPIILPPTV